MNINRAIRFSLVFIIIQSFWSCKSGQQNAGEGEIQKADILRINMDTTVNPGDNFFKYANGGWIKNNPIPPTESRWGIGNLVQEEIYKRLQAINKQDSIITTTVKGTPEQIIGDLYKSAMDSIAIDKQGSSALKPELDKIDKIYSLEGVIDMIAVLQTYQVGPALEVYAAQDEKNSNAVLLHLSQGGLGMPNKDYYLKNDSRTVNIRNEYRKHLEKTFGLLNAPAQMVAARAVQVLEIENALAKASRNLEDLRDPLANYNKMTLNQLDKISPEINWKDFILKMIGRRIDTVIVGQPEFFTALGKALKKYPVDSWKDYLRWQLISTYANQLGGNYEKEHFHFYKTILTGTQQQKPRWKRVIDFENHAIGELLGRQFVKEYFSIETKKRYEKLTDAIIQSFSGHIKNLDWMSDSTKQKALFKLSKITKKVGYPDKWKDFSGMDISRNSYARNAVNINKWWFNYEMNKIGKPVDRSEWDMNPQEYNAYYNPSNNEIVLPAAIFTVPGFKDTELDDAIIFGYAGASTIGHELTHGFDDEGRLYDEKGNLSNWWNKQDELQFVQRADKYVNQFNHYIVLDSLHINGKASLGENIADLGGIVIGLDAFKKTDQYKNNKSIAGLTPMQRYFLGYALGWLVEQREERLANQILTDVHAPAEYRVNGPMSNIPDFYRAFNIQSGQNMYRSDSSRVIIW
jgi:putative endopeptidase